MLSALPPRTHQGSAAGSVLPKIVLSDTADEVLLLLGCIYPGPARTTLTASNALRLLALADK